MTDDSLTFPDGPRTELDHALSRLVREANGVPVTC